MVLESAVTLGLSRDQLACSVKSTGSLPEESTYARELWASVAVTVSNLTERLSVVLTEFTACFWSTASEHQKLPQTLLAAKI